MKAGDEGSAKPPLSNGTAPEDVTTTPKPSKLMTSDLLSKLKVASSGDQEPAAVPKAPLDDEQQIKELDSSIVNVIRKDSPKAKLLNKIIKSEAAADEKEENAEGGGAVVDSWLDFYDDKTDNLKDDLLDKFNKLAIDKKKGPDEEPAAAVVKASKTADKNKMIINYLKFPEANDKRQQPAAAAKGAEAEPAPPSDSSDDLDEYGHLIEIYDFPANFKNENIFEAIREAVGHRNFDLKWVDDTHCLGVFANVNEANQALTLNNSLVKVRAIKNATEESKRKAKRSQNTLKPYKERPQTTSFVASRLIGASLGLNNAISKEKLKIEKQKIANARDQRQKDKNLKDAVWNGDV